MSNAPFDLSRFKAGHPCRTRDGRVATFIAHVPEAVEDDRLLVLIGDDVRHYWEDGCVYESGVSCGDLFLVEP